MKKNKYVVYYIYNQKSYFLVFDTFKDCYIAMNNLRSSGDCLCVTYFVDVFGQFVDFGGCSHDEI